MVSICEHVTEMSTGNWLNQIRTSINMYAHTFYGTKIESKGFEASLSRDMWLF